MANPLQDQLMKAGLVSKKQAHQVKKDKNKKNKQQRAHNQNAVDETKQAVQQAAKEKAEHDRKLNKQKEEKAKLKAIEAEINQLISTNAIDRNESCDIVYNFEHNKKVKHIYVNDEMKQHIIDGKLGIAEIEERYELVARAVAEKIQQRNKQRIILFEKDIQTIDEDDPYADYQIPDDLMW